MLEGRITQERRDEEDDVFTCMCVTARHGSAVVLQCTAVIDSNGSSGESIIRKMIDCS